MTLRDVSEAELRLEPTPVLEAIVSGEIVASWVTRELAQLELDRRGVPVGTTA